MRLASAISLGAFFAASGLARLALADDPEQAANLFAEGRARLEHNDVQGACDKFAQAERLAPKGAGILVNLGLCEEQLGHPAAAYGHFARAVDVLPASDDRRAFAQDHLGALRSRIALVQISVAPTAPGSAQVALDGRVLDPADLGRDVALDPGPHVIDVRAEGRPDRHESVSLRAGEARKIVAEAGQAVSAAPQPAPPPPPPSEPAASSSPGKPTAPESAAPSHDGRKIAMYGLAGIAVVGVGVGAYFEVSGWSKRSGLDACKGSCSQSAIDDARHTMLAGDVSLGIGIAAAAATVYLYLTQPRESPAPSVAVVPGRDGASVVGTWRF